MRQTLPKNFLADFVRVLNFWQILTLEWPPPRIVHWTSNTQSQTHQKIHRNDIKTATKHPKIEFFEKFKKKSKDTLHGDH